MVDEVAMLHESPGIGHVQIVYKAEVGDETIRIRQARC
jgi:hypothetical protein